MSHQSITLSRKAEARLFELSRSLDFARPRKEVDIILGEMAHIRSTGRTNAEEAHFDVFKRYLRGENVEAELRSNNDFLAGTESVSFSEGNVGGVLVPQQFQNAVSEGLAQVDPLLNPEVCSLIQEPDFRLRPLQLPGWDLSTIAAVQVDEGSQHNSDVVPGTTQKLLNKFTYRLSLGASLEWEDDQQAFDSALAAMGRAFGIGFARGIGFDLINGNGSSAPAGILSNLTAKVTTLNNGKIVADDIHNVFFAVNRIYRASKKCAWLMNDAAYELVRKATDNQGRPLLSVKDDQEQLMGKPVYIAPSLPAYNPSLPEQYPGSFCVFGDLSHFYVHATTMSLRRKLQVPGYIEYGKALYTGLLSVDAVLHDPTGGTLPPVIAAALHQ